MREQISLHPKLRTIGVAAVVSAALLLNMAPSPAVARPLVAPRHARQAVGTDSWRMFKVTNASRGRFDLPRLRLNRDLSEVARRHSLAMAHNRELFHTTDVDVYLHGLEWHAWGENVGYTPTDIASLEQAFMGSPSHRENILNGAFHQVAIGAVRVDGTLWVTVFFFG